MKKMEKLLTIAQLAEYIGVSRQTVYNARCLGLNLPPAVRVARSARYRESDVKKWLESQQAEETYKPLVAAPAPIALEKRKRGRPTKLEQAARRKAAKNAIH